MLLVCCRHLHCCVASSAVLLRLAAREPARDAALQISALDMTCEAVVTKMAYLLSLNVPPPSH